MPTLASSSSPTIVPSQMPSKSTKSEKVNPLFPDKLETESPTALNSSSPSIKTGKSSKSDKSNKSNRKLKNEKLNAPSPRRKLLLGDPPFESPPKWEDDIPSSMYSRNTEVTPVPSPDTPAPSPSPVNPAQKKVADIRDWTTRSGLGESPGINNLEFLGLGYDGLRGNPRGSFTSELDPGFRKRVFSLRQDQKLLSIDTAFTVPIGTDFKYISSCKYDSLATEISTFTDYTNALSKEAEMSRGSNTASSKSKTKTTNASAGLKAAFPISKAQISGAYSGNRQTSKTREESKSKTKAFSKSDKTESFKQKSFEESTISFEARAVCSEYEISFHPLAINNTSTCIDDKKEPCREDLLDPMFKSALDKLPFPFNKGEPWHVSIYENFFATYGTHYVERVVLGGKRIFTTELTSRDTAELVKDSVDIANTLSVEMQQAMSSTSSQQWGLSGKTSLGVIGKDNYKDSKFGSEYTKEDGAQDNIKLHLSGGYGLNKDENQEDGLSSVPQEDQEDSQPIIINRLAGKKKQAETPNNGRRKLGQNESSRRRRFFQQNDHPNKIRTINGSETATTRSRMLKQGSIGISTSGSYGQSTTKSNSQSASSQYDNFARTKKQSEDASKISSKNVKITEVNFGGTPSIDWREWAASVKERPMPISYNLVGLWNLMEDSKAEAFYHAFLHIEDIAASELMDSEENSLLSALHFGVSTGTGEPHSSFYSNDPNAEYRALIQVDAIPTVLGNSEDGSQRTSEEVSLIGEAESSTEEKVYAKVGKAVCGMRTTRLLPRSLMPDCLFRIDHDWKGKDDCNVRHDQPVCKSYSEGIDLEQYEGGDRVGMRTHIKNMLPRTRAVTKIELKFCDVQYPTEQYWTTIGDILEGQDIPSTLVNSTQMNEDFIAYYEKLTAADSEMNSSVQISQDNAAEVNKKVDTAECDPGYFMDGIQIRKCLDGGDPLCIDDFSTNDGKRYPWMVSWNNRSRCYEKVDFKRFGVTRDPYGGILGINISCKKINESERKPKRVFCVNVQPKNNGWSKEQKEENTHDCFDETTWGPWFYLPESSSGDSYWSFSGGVAAADRDTKFYVETENMEKRFLGVTDFSLLMREELLPGSGFRDDVVTYAMTWKNKDKKPVALFSSPIRGHIGENSSEETELGIQNANTNAKLSDFLNSYPFAISDDFSSSGIFAMSKFNKRSSDLNSFSFLAVDDLFDNREEFLVAVVSNEGLLLNDYSGNSPITVKLIAETKNMQKFELTISTESEFRMFAFPHWYTNSQEFYPPTPASIAVAVSAYVQEDSNGNMRYQIKAGSTDESFGGAAITRNLGVNIFAVKSDVVNDNIQVGYEEPDTSASLVERELKMEELCKYFGITSGTGLCDEDLKIEVPNLSDEQSFGKRVSFAKDFLSLPSVIVTPVVANDGSNYRCHDMDDIWKFKSDDIVLPHCVVDTITKEFFVAKCACISYLDEDKIGDNGNPEIGSDGNVMKVKVLRYEPLAFNYFAVGPVEQESKNEDFSWTDLIAY